MYFYTHKSVFLIAAQDEGMVVKEQTLPCFGLCLFHLHFLSVDEKRGSQRNRKTSKMCRELPHRGNGHFADAYHVMGRHQALNCVPLKRLAEALTLHTSECNLVRKQAFTKAIKLK